MVALYSDNYCEFVCDNSEHLCLLIKCISAQVWYVETDVIELI